MRVIPRENRVRLISESPLEDDAMVRWKHGLPRVSVRYNHYHDAVEVEITFEDGVVRPSGSDDVEGGES